MNQIESTGQLRCSMGHLTMNELCFDTDIFYDQPCFWGCRMDRHAVYCHNEDTKDMPMKCRLTPEEQLTCEGFKKNEPFKENK